MLPLAFEVLVYVNGDQFASSNTKGRQRAEFRFSETRGFLLFAGQARSSRVPFSDSKIRASTDVRVLGVRMRFFVRLWGFTFGC